MATHTSRQSVSNKMPSFTLTRRPSEECLKIQQDLTILAQKISDISGEPMVVNQSPMAASSSFVSGLRNMTSEVKEAPEDDKLTQLEKILSKTGELDRLVLRKTAPNDTIEPSPASSRRRNGADLFSMPTHLAIIDRLLDLHAQIKRGNIIKESYGSTTKPPLADNTTLQAVGDNINITNHSAFKQLAKQFEKSEKSKAQLDKENQELQRVIANLNQELSAAKSSHSVEDKPQLNNNENEAREAEIKQLRSEVAQYQAAATITSHDKAALETEVQQLRAALLLSNSAAEKSSAAEQEIQQLRHELEQSETACSQMVQTHRAQLLELKQQSAQSQDLACQKLLQYFKDRLAQARGTDSSPMRISSDLSVYDFPVVSMSAELSVDWLTVISISGCG